MAHPKGSARRSRLFSLNARIERRALSRAADERPGASHAVDDGCPICVAQRSGAPTAFDISALFPSADGAPPPIEESFLIAEARKALEREQPASGKSISFIQFGSKLPDGSFASSGFSVESDGRIFWTSPTQRKLVGQVPRTHG